MGNYKIFHATIVTMLVTFACFHNALGSNEPAGSEVMCIEHEKQALLDFKKGFVDESSLLLSSWGAEEAQNCCQWPGVQCNNRTGHVVSLHLSHLGLKGKIRHSLLQLRHLRHLDLSFSVLDNIPPFIGFLSKLTFLNLSHVYYPVTTSIPSQIVNLSYLRVLDLSWSDNLNGNYSPYKYYPYQLGYNNGLMSTSLEWVSHLSFLKYLDLSNVDLSEAADWLQSIAMLPSLRYLQLFNCQLPMPKPIPISTIACMTSSNPLTYLGLGNNRLNSTIFDWLSNIATNLTHIDLSGNRFSGEIPKFLRAMTSLRQLNLSDNAFEGHLPDFLGGFDNLAQLDIARNKLAGPLLEFPANNTSLQYLDLSANAFIGPIPESLGNISSLWYLNLSLNGFEGIVPKSFGRLHNLEVLDLSSNQLADTQFNVSFLESIGQLSTLTKLKVSFNSLCGTISEFHFRNLSNLRILDMSENSFTMNLSLDWHPPFQLDVLKLGSCNIGPQFPSWIRTQYELSSLDLSHSGISGAIPDWFWRHFSGYNIEYLNLSHNSLYGSLPSDLSLNSTHFYVAIIDLSHNFLHGSVPPSLMNSTTLSLSNNLFSGTLSAICAVPPGKLLYLDLSNNVLSGRLPNCWSRWQYLCILNLANNSFIGNLPGSLGSLPYLRALHLSKNNLNGKLPSSLRNCVALEVLDLAENNISGSIPSWLGRELKNLLILSLRSNDIHGKIPSDLCTLSSLHILDLSVNNLSGQIPECVNNFTAMSRGWSFDPYFYQPTCRGYAQYEDIVSLDIKGIEREFKMKKILTNLIDLSMNQLSGEIPRGLASLTSLISLNLSRNHLTGQIPDDIGQLTYLDTLDLSRNQLHGNIPWSLSSLSFLGTLNLSLNNLSGRIPQGSKLLSFDTSVYAGNPGLCGPPLSACQGDDGTTTGKTPLAARNNQENHGGEDDDEFSWMLQFFVSMALGYVVGFWAFVGAFLANRSWRCAFFRCLSEIGI